MKTMPEKNIPEVKQNYTNLERWLLVGLCSVCNQAGVVRDGDWTDRENYLCPEKKKKRFLVEINPENIPIEFLGS